MRWTRPAIALSVVALSLAAVGAADVVLTPAPPEGPAAGVTARDDVVSGRAVCAVGDSREGSETRLEVVHPGAIGSQPVRLEAYRFGDEGSTLRASQLFPTTGAVTPLGGEGDDAVAGSVEWQDAPLAVARSWRVEDAEDLPPGTAAGPCPVSTAATTWTIPGASTSGGTEALLRLANPHPTGATVAVRFLTPEGPEAPTRLRNLSVGSEATAELSLNEFIPERSDVTVIVEVVSGRVAAEGVQFARSAIGDVDGVSLLQAATEPAEAWTVPWVSDTDERDPWLWVANDDDRTARVELTVHTAEGGLPAAGLSEVAVPPRSVRRIDLRGVLPEDGTAAVTVRSDGVPVTVSGAVELRSSDVEDTGLVVQRGAAGADTGWTLTGGPTEGRRNELRLVNPTSEPATVDAVLWDGAAAELPEELTAVEVPAGAVVAVPLTEVLGELDRWSLSVEARTGAVVAGTVSGGDPTGPAHWVASIGTPASAWTTEASPAVRLARGTVQRLGTELGIGPFDPFAPAIEDDDEDPLEPSEVPLDGPTVPPPDDGDGAPAEGEDAPDPEDAPAPEGATDPNDDGAPQDTEPAPGDD